MKLTEEQANAAYDILIAEAGAREDDRYGFVFHTAKVDPPTTEYRFMGHLGFGGKFWPAGYGRLPYVTCYRESETPERLAIIEKTNAALTELFAGRAALGGSRE